MTRKQEIMEDLNNNRIYDPLVNHMVYLEKQLEDFMLLPKIKIDPTDPQRQKLTPACKAYHDYLQQYINMFKVLQKAVGSETEVDESSLTKWLKMNEVELR